MVGRHVYCINVLRFEDRGIMKPGNGRNFRWWRTPSLGGFEQRFLGVRVYCFAA